MSGEDYPNVPKLLRDWLIVELGRHVRDRVFYQRVPTPKKSRGPCVLDRPYIWFSRADTETEECLEHANHSLLQAVGVAQPAGESSLAGELQTFDVEIWSQDPFEVEESSFRLRRGSPYGNGDWFSDLKVINQADDYFSRGSHDSYVRGGATVASVQIEVCPLSVLPKKQPAKAPWWTFGRDRENC